MNVTYDINPPRTIGQASVESQVLFKFLENTKPGQLITYMEIHEVSKVDVQKVPSVLNTARRNMQNIHKVVFATVRGIGIKRLENDEIPGEGFASIKRTRNIARKGVKTLSCADPSTLPADLKVRLITNSTILGFIAQSGSKKTLNLVEQNARVSNEEMKIGNVADLFAK